MVSAKAPARTRRSRLGVCATARASGLTPSIPITSTRCCPGSWADKHGVHDNEFKGKNYKQFPHFFQRLKDQFPQARTASFVDWSPIDEHIVTAADLKKGMASLATIGATAVFVGLLATTIGVINAFGAIGTTGSSGLGAVSSGISEALVGTAVGLLVAIPAVWFYNYLTGRLEFFNVEMDNSSSELVDYFIRLEL